LRIQTVSNAESAKGIEAGSLLGAAETGFAAGAHPRVNDRVAIAHNTAMYGCDDLVAFVIYARILSPQRGDVALAGAGLYLEYTISGPIGILTSHLSPAQAPPPTFP
jgi:hypothetical protein